MGKVIKGVKAVKAVNSSFSAEKDILEIARIKESIAKEARLKAEAEAKLKAEETKLANELRLKEEAKARAIAAEARREEETRLKAEAKSKIKIEKAKLAADKAIAEANAKKKEEERKIAEEKRTAEEVRLKAEVEAKKKAEAEAKQAEEMRLAEEARSNTEIAAKEKAEAEAKQAEEMRLAEEARSNAEIAAKEKAEAEAKRAEEMRLAEEARSKAETAAKEKAEAEAKRLEEIRLTEEVRFKTEVAANEKAKAEARVALENRLIAEAKAKATKNPEPKSVKQSYPKYSKKKRTDLSKPSGAVHVAERTVPKSDLNVKDLWCSSFRDIFSLPNDDGILEKMADFKLIKESSFSNKVISRLLSRGITDIGKLADSSRRDLSRIYGWSSSCQEEVDDFFVILASSEKRDVKKAINKPLVEKMKLSNESKSFGSKLGKSEGVIELPSLLSIDRQYLSETLGQIIGTLEQINVEDYYDMVVWNKPELLKRYAIDSEEGFFYLLKQLFSNKYKFEQPYISKIKSGNSR